MLKFLLSSIMVLAALPAISMTCQEAMLNAGYDKTQFRMHGSNTIEILREEPEIAQCYMRHSINAPKCNIISSGTDELAILAGQPGESVEIIANNITALQLANFGTLKVNSIIISADRFIPKNKQRDQYCGLSNSREAKIEAKTIDINCKMVDEGFALQNNGMIRAVKIKAISTPDYGIAGIDNGANDGPGSIIADTIEGIGCSGIRNSKKASIQARKIYGSAPDEIDKGQFATGVDNRGKMIADTIEGNGADRGISNFRGTISGKLVIGLAHGKSISTGIENGGIIKTNTAKCCGATNYCYSNKLGGNPGKISVTPENICSKLPTKVKK